MTSPIDGAGGLAFGPSVPLDSLKNRVEPWADARRAAQEGRTEEATQAFGDLLATLLVRELRRSIPEGLVGDGPGSDVYEGWFDEHLGRTLAESDALGLAGMIKASFERAARADGATETGGTSQ